ncbi:MAG TPA: type II toxin-antitoxin system VapC family toxin [Solirubrobacterales bacterium]|nr:type II toxin-antitoxin system VapC family toxin [Solirubrobacterales bacterium]
MGRLAYVDSSAYVKLPLEEEGDGALREELADWHGYVSSELLGVEAIRACARYGAPYAQDAREWLLDVSLLPLDDAVLGVAAMLQPAGLRSLDAIHLATALTVREEIGAFIAYDDRLAAAAGDHRLPVVQPGA